MSTSHRRSPVETRAVLGVGLVLIAWAWLAAPVGELPRSANSWDPLHSGRRFAEQGFLASQLQPVWSPPNHRAPYLTYTHYPPLPYWLAGIVDVAVHDPFARIEALLRIVLSVGLGALLCGYLFLRSVALSPPAAAFACLVLVWSGHWWAFATGELSWVSWLQLFQLGSVAALGAAFARWQTHGRRGLLLALLCAAAAALSAFDAWPWLPTLLAVLALGAARFRPDRLRALVLATALATTASLGGVATRVAINWWHFGTLERVVQDAHEAYSARRTYAHQGLEIAENQANYMELPAREAAPHLAWIAEFWRSLPARAGSLFLPDAAAGRRALAFVAVLALPGWWLRRRRRVEPDPPGPADWPGRAGWLVALTSAALPFVLLCPALAVQQWGPLLAFTPAVLLAAALIGEGVLALLGAITRGRLDAAPPRTAAALVIAAAVAASVLLRADAAPSATWPAPPAECEAAVRALSQLEGVVFVDLDDVNPLMFLVPRDSGLALKPIWTRLPYLSDVRPIRILRIHGQGKLSQRALAKLRPIELSGLPAGWELLLPAPSP